MLYNHRTVHSIPDVNRQPPPTLFLSRITNNKMKPLFLPEEIKSPLSPAKFERYFNWQKFTLKSKINVKIKMKKPITKIKDECNPFHFKAKSYS